MQSDTDSYGLSNSEAEAKRIFVNNRLKDRLEELMKENTTLHEQFNEAVQLSSKIEDLYRENAELLSQIRSLKAEKDDLKQRMEILIQKEREKTMKLKNEKKVSTTQRNSDLNYTNKEIQRAKAQCKVQIDSIYDQLEEANQRAEKESVEKRLLIRNLNNLINSAGRYFETNFNSVEDVLNAFNQPRPTASQNTSISQSAIQSRSMLSTQQQQQKNDRDQLKKKIKRLKKQLEEKENELQKVQEEKVKLNRDFERSKKENATTVQSLTDHIQQLQAQMQHDADQYSHNLSQYEYKLNALKAKMDKEKEREKEKKRKSSK